MSPGDHPTLDPSVVRLLLAAYARGGPSVVVPSCGGRRGHPTLIAWRHAAGVRAHPAGEGLNSYLRARADETLELPVADAGVLCDLDTAEDYERLRTLFDRAGTQPG
jgi:CTP:molybdopterin cytidylyltransferase MocA